MLGEEEQKRHVKLEFSGRIADTAFLGALDTLEKAGSPSSPLADGVSSEQAQCWDAHKGLSCNTHALPSELQRQTGLLHSGFSPSRNDLASL